MYTCRWFYLHLNSQFGRSYSINIQNLKNIKLSNLDKKMNVYNQELKNPLKTNTIFKKTKKTNN